MSTLRAVQDDKLLKSVACKGLNRLCRVCANKYRHTFQASQQEYLYFFDRHKKTASMGGYVVSCLLAITRAASWLPAGIVPINTRVAAGLACSTNATASALSDG